MYWNGEWGAVCNYPSISSNAAQVACRQLGFAKVIDYDSIKLLGYAVKYNCLCLNFFDLVLVPLIMLYKILRTE